MLLLSIIGQSEYGLYQIVASLIAYLKILQNGLSVGVSRYYCVYKAANDTFSMQNILGIARRVYHALSIIIAIVGIALIGIVRVVYASSFTSAELFECQIMLVLLIISMIVEVNNTIYVSAITAEEKFVFLKGIDILSIVSQPIVVIAILTKFPYATSIVAVQLLLNIMFALIRHYYATNKIGVIVKLHKNNPQLVKGLLIFSGTTILALIADQIFWKTDQLILAKIYGTSIVAIYSVGCQVYTNYMHFSTSISSVFMPRVSQLYGDGTNTKPVSDLFIKIGRIQFLILLMVLITFSLYGNDFLRLWVGSGYEDAYLVAVVVMVAFTIDLTQNIGLTILQVANKYAFRAKMYFIIAVINIISTILLSLKYGCIGAAISTAFSMVIGSGFIMNYYYQKVMHLDIFEFWKQILKLLSISIPAILAGGVIKQINISNGWIDFLLHCMFFVLFYCGIMYKFACNEYEKKLAHRIKSLITKNKKN